MYIENNAKRGSREGAEGAGGRPFPVLEPGKIHYEVSKRAEGICWGGLGLVQQLVQRLGLAESIDRRLGVFKRHLPYHESDHVLNQIYNVLSGGSCLQDLEAKRRDAAYLKAVGAERLPAPSTGGDFLRRLSARQIRRLQEAFDEARVKVWKAQKKSWRKLAVIDVDGTMAPTCGECKEGMSLSYDGQWGYHPLVISLANSNEVLSTLNRPGNRPSHEQAPEWIRRAVKLVRRGGFKKVRLRGDTDFGLTAHFDGWSEDGVQFVFGKDAHPGLVKRAGQIPEQQFSKLHRRRPAPQGPERSKAARVKEQIVVEKGYKNRVLEEEHVAELEYRPAKCKRSCRLVVLRKTTKVLEGQTELFQEPLYFFYITNVPRRELSTAEVVRENNRRCNQENVIKQLKGGVSAMRMPSDTLESNWAWLAITAQAWNLKAWLGLALPAETGASVVRMHFRRFLRQWMQLPCQILRRGGRLIFRLLAGSEQAGGLLQASLLLRSHRLLL